MSSQLPRVHSSDTLFFICALLIKICALRQKIGLSKVILFKCKHILLHFQRKRLNFLTQYKCFLLGQIITMFPESLEILVNFLAYLFALLLSSQHSSEGNGFLTRKILLKLHFQGGPSHSSCKAL